MAQVNSPETGQMKEMDIPSMYKTERPSYGPKKAIGGWGWVWTLSSDISTNPELALTSCRSLAAEPHQIAAGHSRPFIQRKGTKCPPEKRPCRRGGTDRCLFMGLVAPSNPQL